MDEYCMAKRMLMEVVSKGQVWGRLRLGWMNGAKVALGSTGITVEAMLQCTKDRNEWSALVLMLCNWLNFTYPFLLGPVFFWTILPCSGGYHLERGGMLLHGAVGVNSKNGTTTENQGTAAQVSSIWNKGCMLDDCVCVIWFDRTTRP